MKLLIFLILILLSSSTLFGQNDPSLQKQKSSELQSYVFIPVISDTNYTPFEMQKVPQITGWDIGGQFALSLLSGTIFSIGGGLLGNSLSSHQNEINMEAVIGFLLGYTLGSSLGVYAAASNKKYDPSLLGLIGSGILGELTGIFLYTLSNNDTPNPNILAFAPFVLPPIFAIVTLNAFQQKKSNIKISFDVQQLPQPNAYSYGVKLQYGF